METLNLKKQNLIKNELIKTFKKLKIYNYLYVIVRNLCCDYESIYRFNYNLKHIDIFNKKFICNYKNKDYLLCHYKTKIIIENVECRIYKT